MSESHRNGAASDLAHVPVGMFHAAPDGRVLQVSDLLCDIVGRPRAELVGMSIQELIHPDEQARVLALLEALTAGTAPRYTREMRFIRGDGGAFPGGFHVSLVRDADGSPTYLIGVVEDLAERQQVLEDLRASERKVSAILRASVNVSLITTDLGGVDSRITSFSPGAERMFGIPAGEAVGTPVARLHLPEDVARFPAFQAQLREGGAGYSGETTLVRATGERFPAIFTIQPLTDDRGAVTGALGVSLDITERTRVERELAVERDRLRRAQAVSHVGSWEYDLVTNEIWGSEEAYRIYGMPPSTGRLPIDEIEACIPERERVHQALVDLLERDLPYDLQFEIRPADGSQPRIIRSVAELLRDEEGRPHRVVGVIEDVTERLALEEQLRASQRLESIGRLAGGVAHDFNNLLTVINSLTEMVMGDLPPTSLLRQDLEQVHEAGGRAAALTRQLLAFSRRQVLQPRLLDPAEVLSGMERMLRRLLGEDVELVLRTAPGTGRIMADPSQVEQVLMNLAVNARDAMPDGGHLVIEARNVDLDEPYVRLHPDAAPGPKVMIAVTDDGLGMDEGTVSRIFEPFFTTKGRGAGTGLGLATAYGIVRQSGGSIAVVSQPGHGTTFTIHLPRVVGESTAAASPTAAQVAGGSETILVVEDDEGVRGLTERILVRAGYRVFTASGGAAALATFRHVRVRFDLVLTDVIMPDMNGREVAEALTALEPSLRVLFMSGYTDDVIVQRGVLEPGMNFLPKPFAARELLDAVRAVLDGAPAV